MSVIYPNDKQIQASVHNICEKAPLTRRPSLISFLRDMSRNLGLRQIFTGTWDVILISCMLFGLAAVIGALDLRHSGNQLQKTSVFLFAFSPVFLFLLFSLSLWNKLSDQNDLSLYRSSSDRVPGVLHHLLQLCRRRALRLISVRVFRAAGTAAALRFPVVALSLFAAADPDGFVRPFQSDSLRCSGGLGVWQLRRLSALAGTLLGASAGGSGWHIS